MSLTPDERAAVAEALAERAAIREFDGGEDRVAAEEAARCAMRVYRVLVRMGDGRPDRGVVLLAPECDLAEATQIARDQFGPERVVSVTEAWRHQAQMAPRRDSSPVDALAGVGA